MSEHNYYQVFTASIHGDFSGVEETPTKPACDPDELVTFHLTLPRGILENLYWFDMEASDGVYTKIEDQLIDQGFIDERYRSHSKVW